MRGRGIALMAGASMGRKRGEEQAQMQMQQQQAQQQQAQAAQQPPAPAPAPAAAPAPGKPDITGELQKLAQLHQSGALSDEEFASAKQKLLSS